SRKCARIDFGPFIVWDELAVLHPAAHLLSAGGSTRGQAAVHVDQIGGTTIDWNVVARIGGTRAFDLRPMIAGWQQATIPDQHSFKLPVEEGDRIRIG